MLMLLVDEKKQLEAEGQGNEKAYHVEARNLLEVVIAKNKDEKAVHTLPSPQIQRILIPSQLNVIVELVVGRFQEQVQRMVPPTFDPISIRNEYLMIDRNILP
jgi:hypothetical protein